MNNVVIRKTNPQEEQRKAVCLEQMTQDRQQLLLRWPFIGGIIMRMELVPVRDDRLETASTDGDRIFADIDFYGSLNRDERLFVLAHEVWHSVLMHFARKQNRDAKLFNIAADLEIHFALAGEKMREPWVLPHDEHWAGLPAEEIYEKLIVPVPDLPMESKGGKPGNPAGNGTSSKSRHPDGQDTKPAEKPGRDRHKSFDKHLYDGEQNDGSGPVPENGSGTDGKSMPGDDKSPESASDFVMDDDYAPAIAGDVSERIRGRVIASAQQIERTQGTLPANARALLDRLQKPEIPWQEMLKQFVTSCYGGKRRWLPPARRHVWQDLYLPSMRDESLHAVAAIDTSGSTQHDLAAFFGELVSLMKSFGRFDLDVIQCDAGIQSVEHFSDARVPPPDHRWEVKGLGGTDFRPVFDHVAKERLAPDLLIYFTDGMGTAPANRPPYPVLWILTDDGVPPCEWGRKIRFKSSRQKKK